VSELEVVGRDELGAVLEHVRHGRQESVGDGAAHHGRIVSMGTGPHVELDECERSTGREWAVRDR
jgi:hypothetical protein